MTDLQHLPPETIRLALTELVAQDGDETAAAASLKEQEILDVPPATLRQWREDFSEVHTDIERIHAKFREDEIKAMLLTRAHRAAEIEARMMETMATQTSGKDLPNALRSISNVKSSSLDALMKLTGRAPVDGGQSGSLEQTLRGLARDGLVKINVNLEAPSDP